MIDVTLEPCPFCGNALSIRSGVNPYGRCKTDRCWMADRKIVVPFKDSVQVDQWNTRTRPVNAIETVARAILPILWTKECFNGISLLDIDRCRRGGDLDMGGRVELYEEQAVALATAISALNIIE